ncbi:MAG: hypothetical protein MR692_00445 [Prevotella sp.]|nr:hypothetical protein [Prevotella sp.]MCI6128836.1 hypothetical protein [Prevotella sp.]MDY3968635.1 hypothetical protein [Prevotella sp.]
MFANKPGTLMSAIWQTVPTTIDHIRFLLHTWTRIVNTTAIICATSP